MDGGGGGQHPKAQAALVEAIDKDTDNSDTANTDTANTDTTIRHC